ncbi:MAG: hypothetical protein GY822_15170 [Deltaproteobacteria bacterium]|nr:hypothetical protein [Deltaproteobacteria bacterium]
MNKDRLIASLILVPVLAGAFFSLARLSSESDDVPTEEHYEAVANFLHQEMSKQDGLVVLPAWTLRPQVHLQGIVWEPGDNVDTQLFHRYESLFVLVEPDGERGLELLQTRFGKELQKTFQVGNVEIYKVEMAKHQMAGYDFRASVDDNAVVQLHKKGKVIDCSLRTTGGWRCPGKDSWQRVTRERLLVAENGRSALWAHPPRPGEKVTVRFDNLQLGTSLAVSGGFTRKASAHAKAPVRLRAFFYGDLAEEDSFVDANAKNSRVKIFEKSFEVIFDWRSAEVSTKEHAGKKGAVVFEISSKDYRQGHFAFDALLVEGGAFTPLPPLPAPIEVNNSDGGQVETSTSAAVGTP